ncbi:hypothetical protein PPYR_08715 [Photinus pyralis]|uniref:Peptidase M13 N-terminal domain-containing protein n=1 Tax=Photinus pyralis TaxID=7054 RepID=A0A5N4AK41_PHOPY|nr:neprilysin-2-like isoform X1 [Photinus pyralis]KAB0797722.1 hypothetical protein PPYR_08715 [Photinus pyralis]
MAHETNDVARRNRNNSWWKRRTSLEKKGVILLVIALILLIALIIALAVVAHRKSKSEEICNTAGCVRAASKIINTMNARLDPCTDFYEFACGNFIRDTVIPDDRMEISPFTEAGNMLEQQLRALYSAPITADDIRPFVLLKTFYQSCMNNSAIEVNGLLHLRELVNKLGGFPIVENVNWNENAFDWQQAAYKLRRNGLNYNKFIKLDILPDMKNSSRICIYLDQPELDLGKDNLALGAEDGTVEAYTELLVDLAVLWGADKAFAKYEVKNLIEFMQTVANASQSDEERRDRASLYNPMTISELQQKYPTIYWLEYLNNILILPQSHVTSKTQVSVHSPHFISVIDDILRRTSKRVLANYIIFDVIRSFEMFVPDEIRNRELQFEGVLTGAEQREPRWSQCVAKTTASFDLASSSIFVRKHFDPESKKSVGIMVDDIRNEFIEILRKTEWMDSTTKQTAIDKAKAIKSYIGYADELLDNKKLGDHYATLTLVPGSSIDHVRNISIFDRDLEIDLLSKKFDPGDWRTRYAATEVNAAYAGYENSIQIPAAILQNVFYSKDRLQALNYGGIGYFIGHEITHGFDDQGRKLNVNGNLEDWWAKDTNDAFLDKAKCIIEQYSNYTDPEVNVPINGELTQGENIADNGGIKEAYLAYNAWVKRNGPEQKLPGLKYTPKQLFWISVANCWCTKTRKEYLASSIPLDEHSPARFRILGPLSNFEDFSRDFNCPLGSRMNPPHKCKVW